MRVVRVALVMGFVQVWVMNRAHSKPAADEDGKADVRVDKWLWTVRVFKTRELAAEACRAGRVSVGGREVKPAHSLQAGQVIEVRQGPLTRRLVMLAAPKSRQGAARLGDFMRDETPPEVYEKAAEMRREQGQSEAVGKSDNKRDRQVLRALWGDE